MAHRCAMHPKATDSPRRGEVSFFFALFAPNKVETGVLRAESEHLVSTERRSRYESDMGGAVRGVVVIWLRR